MVFLSLSSSLSSRKHFPGSAQRAHSSVNKKATNGAENGPFTAGRYFDYFPQKKAWDLIRTSQEATHVVPAFFVSDGESVN